jgi:hypothetical protein
MVFCIVVVVVVVMVVVVPFRFDRGRRVHLLAIALVVHFGRTAAHTVTLG